MDKQNRLTKWEEWEIGARYEWLKGKTPIGRWTCTEVNRRAGYVAFNRDNAIVTKTFAWQRRYRRI
jgi:hypothetical protein